MEVPPNPALIQKHLLKWQKILPSLQTHFSRIEFHPELGRNLEYNI